MSKHLPSEWFEEVQHGLLQPVRHLGCPTLPLYVGVIVALLSAALTGFKISSLFLSFFLLGFWVSFLATTTRDDYHVFKVYYRHLLEGRGHYPARITVRDGGLLHPQWHA